MLLGAILGTQAIAAMIAGFGILVTPIQWSYIGLIWVYCLIRAFIEDWSKLAVYRHFRRTSARHRSFLETLGGSLHIHGRRNRTFG